MKENQAPKTIRLQDYRRPDFLIDEVDLHIVLGEQSTQVSSTLSVVRADAGSHRSLVLDGEELVLKSIKMDGEHLMPSDYVMDDECLTIQEVPARCVLEIVTEIYPQNNTSLEGLYQSSGNFCTQCEAQGFRKITYYLDRPDVMARFRTTLVADKARYPVLLANGNCIDRQDLANGQHSATWEDPHPKPAYLFALVAGDLAHIEDFYTTASGREVCLKIYTEAHNIGQCSHAMASLKHAMRWDEQVYGLEYDLDIYMIVAVDDFNMGAMENKGLNIFNSKFVLADKETATDQDFLNIEAVIAHEYFHNWTGNRVTCRDWFQLSLKEGLTVFRDQTFSADRNNPDLKRIEDVRLLRARQFPEDASPVAHPVRPASYIEINNFYTVTVYEKGAEVIRMMHTLLGAKNFRKGMDLYFARHDGQAVTCDDFVQAMQDASGIDLTQFKRWYGQAGTPELTVTEDYDADSEQYALTVSQRTPPTPGQPDKQVLHIPLALALMSKDGQELETGRAQVVDITQAKQRIVFDGIKEKPVPSLLRGFSAPVKLAFDYPDEDLAFLMAHDTDAFNRWEAAQTLSGRVIKKLSDDVRQGKSLVLNTYLRDACEKLLSESATSPAIVAAALALPTEETVGEAMPLIDIEALFHARQFVKKSLAEAFESEFERIYYNAANQSDDVINPDAMACRQIKNLCLSYLGSLQSSQWETLGYQQFQRATTMTDTMAALSVLTNIDGEHREQALSAFYRKWQGQRLVIDKWFTVQALSTLPDTLARVRQLTGHDDFEPSNPNRLRALVGAFCLSNPVRFHQQDGEGYRLLADYVVEMNTRNPQIAARLVTGLSRWRRYDAVRQGQMKSHLERLLDLPDLSKDVYEIVSKSLDGDKTE